MEIQNPNPVICDEKDFQLSPRSLKLRKDQELDPEFEDSIDSQEIFEMVKLINDPEHPLTLQQLKIVHPNDIKVKGNYVTLHFTPTIPHCSLAQTIGLFLKVKLIRSLPKKMKITILIKEGTHSQEEQVNKQINDKERIAAALENPNIIRLVNKGIANTDMLPELEKLLEETFNPKKMGSCCGSKKQNKSGNCNGGGSCGSKKSVKVHKSSSNSNQNVEAN